MRQTRLMWLIAVSEAPRSEACIPYPGSVTAAGYGTIYHKGKTRTVHRVMYELVHGDIPEGFSILHLCKQSRSCCNPEHLYAGTQQDNVNDMMLRDKTYKAPPPVPVEARARGEHNGARLHPEKLCRGAGHKSAKLTDEAVMEMRAAYTGGATLAEVGVLFGVSTHAATDAISGKGWSHVPGSVALRPGNQGELHGLAKMTESLVREIRALRAGVKGVDLARRFNVSPATISLIVNRKAWVHVE